MIAVESVVAAAQYSLRLVLFILKRKDVAIKIIVEPELADEIRNCLGLERP